MSKKTERQLQLENLAIKITRWIGTPQSILIHTALFGVAFAFYFWGVSFDSILLILTTIVSLEAIYLSLFIQLSVNKNTESLEDVEEDIGEIQEDVEGLEGEFDEIQEDVEGLEGNLKKIHQNVTDLGVDVEEISVDIDKLSEEDASEEDIKDAISSQSLQNIEKQLITVSSGLIALRDDLEVLKRNIKK